MLPFTGDHSQMELIGYMEWLTGSTVNNSYDSGTDLFHPYTGTLSGVYEAYGLGWEAAYTNYFGTESKGDLFKGNVLSTFGSLYDVDFTNDEIYFSDPDHQPKIYFTDASDNQVEMWVLDIAVNIAYLPGVDSYNLAKGSIIAGFNDSFSDNDHDDLIVSLQAAQVPEPATMMMLSCGCLALLRRRRA